MLLLRLLLYIFAVFIFIYLMVLPLIIIEKKRRKKALSSISKEIQKELKRTPSYEIMGDENKKLYKKDNRKEMCSWFGLFFGMALISGIALYIAIDTVDGDLSILRYFLYMVCIPAGLIAVLFLIRDGLRANPYKETYEVRAYCQDTYYLKGGRMARVLYYDFKKMTFHATTIPVSGSNDIGYNDFFYAMAIDKGDCIKVIDISPKEYKKRNH